MTSEKMIPGALELWGRRWGDLWGDVWGERWEGPFREVFPEFSDKS